MVDFAVTDVAADQAVHYRGRQDAEVRLLAWLLDNREEAILRLERLVGPAGCVSAPRRDSGPRFAVPCGATS